MDADTTARTRMHAALADERRLRIVDALELTDRTPSELRRLTGLDSNLLSFHLNVLEDAGLVARRRSSGDARRRYVSLKPAQLDVLRRTATAPAAGGGPVLFVCTRNAARSQLAAALWHDRTGEVGASAGHRPASSVDRLARDVAAALGLRLADQPPRSYDEVDEHPSLVVSVCDRARESGLPWRAPQLHWSVPDPAGGTRSTYEATLDDLAGRVGRLADVHGRAA